MVFINSIFNSMIQHNNLCRREKTKKNRRVKLLDVPPITVPNQIHYEYGNNLPNYCMQTPFPISNDFCLHNQQFLNLTLQPYPNNTHYEEYVPMDFDIVQIFPQFLLKMEMLLLKNIKTPKMNELSNIF